jgi:hypothetical protein
MYSELELNSAGGDATAPHKVLVVATNRATLQWIREELAELPVRIEIVPSLVALLAMAVAPAPPTRPLAIIDFDELSDDDLRTMRTTRPRDWPGVLIGLGYVAPSLQHRLRIVHDIARPLGSEALRKAVTESIRPLEEITAEMRAATAEPLRAAASSKRDRS